MSVIYIWFSVGRHYILSPGKQSDVHITARTYLHYHDEQEDSTLGPASSLMFILLYVPTCFIMFRKKTVQFECNPYDFQQRDITV